MAGTPGCASTAPATDSHRSIALHRVVVSVLAGGGHCVGLRLTGRDRFGTATVALLT